MQYNWLMLYRTTGLLTMSKYQWRVSLSLLAIWQCSLERTRKIPWCETCVCCYLLTFSLLIESSIWNRPVDSRCGWKWTQTVCHWFYRYIYCTCFYSFHVDPSGTYMQYNAKAIGIYSITCDMLVLMCMASRIRFRRRSNNLTGRIP